MLHLIVVLLLKKSLVMIENNGIVNYSIEFYVLVYMMVSYNRLMMTTDHPSHTRDLVLFIFGPLINGAYQQLSNIVRNEGSGSGVARISGGLDLYNLLKQPEQKELLSIFSGAMVPFSIQLDTKLIVNVDYSRFQTIVDIGRNQGTFLAQILQNYSSIQHGIVFDLIGIINQCKHGKEFTSREISKDRWSFISGDMFDSSTIPLADVYVLKNIVHNYNDEKCIEILSSIRQANKNKKCSSVTLFIIELVVLPEGALSNWQTHGIDVIMAAVFDNARERTEDEFKDLLQKSGFEFKKLYPIQAPYSVIEGILIQ